MAMRRFDHCGNETAHEQHNNGTPDGPYCNGAPSALAAQREHEANPPGPPSLPKPDWWGRRPPAPAPGRDDTTGAGDWRREEPCRLGYEEYDGSRYCFAHGGFVLAGSRRLICDRTPRPLPLHRTEAGYPRCATCDGGGCPDCTDPS